VRYLLFKNKPLVSVITPSFNQVKYIEETIKSVLMQDYENVEHIVIDGGSADGTLEILKKYRLQVPKFRFISEKDKGQSHALNKGLRMAKGQYIGWLNSDDTYLPGAISKAVEAFQSDPLCGMVYGKANFTDENNQPIKPYPVYPFSIEKLFNECIICQPAAFVKKEVFNTIGGIDESLYFCMDYDFWMKAAKRYQVGYINENLATSRLHSEAKTVREMNRIGFLEIFKVSNRNFGTVSNHWVWAFAVNNYSKGRFWLMENLKNHSIFGPSPKIINFSTEFNTSNWGVHDITIQLDPAINTPIHSIILQKKYPNERYMILIDGKLIRNIKYSKDTIEIPLGIVKSDFELKLIPHAGGGYRNTPLNSEPFQQDFLFLSYEEYKFFQHLLSGPKTIKHWLNENRKPIPHF
jgi:glycosyltransferase involved in cell wall biosynthesis